VDDPDELRGAFWNQPLEVHRFCVQDLVEDGGNFSGLERPLVAQKLVRQDPKGENVRSCIAWLAPNLLGS
jgi:hypothetical protein